MALSIEKKFFKIRRFFIIYMLLGSLGVISLFIFPDARVTSPLLLPLILGIIEFIASKVPILKFKQNLFEFKPAPFAPLQIIKNQDLQTISSTEKEIELDLHSQTKNIKIPLKIFSESDGQKVIHLFESMIKKNQDGTGQDGTNNIKTTHNQVKKPSLINALMIFGILINITVLISATIYASAGIIPQELVIIMGAFLGINIAGIILSAISFNKMGPILVIIGNIMFLPIGLIGAFGGRRSIDAFNRYNANQ